MVPGNVFDSNPMLHVFTASVVKWSLALPQDSIYHSVMSYQNKVSPLNQAGARMLAAAELAL